MLGVGMLTVSASNTYTGTTTITGGTLSAAAIAVSGGSSSLGNAASPVALGSAAGAPPGSGTLLYTGTSATFTRGLTVNAGGGQLINAGGGTLSISSGGVSAVGPFAVGGTSGSDIGISSPITGSGGLVKTGGDTLTLSAVNGYGGTTAVSGGVLRLQAPVPVAGSAMWLNASQGFTVSGSTTTWTDQSGNGNNAVNTAATGPTLSGTINGIQAVNFNGSSQYLAGGLAGSNSATTSLTFFIVHKDSAFKNVAAYVDTPGWTNGSIGIMQSNNAQANQIQYSVQSKGDYLGSTTMTGNVPELDEIVDNNGTVNLYVNGVANGSFSYSAGTTKNLSQFDIGAWLNGTLQRWYSGSIGEILVYDSALNAASRQTVESYLDSKWLGLAPSNILPTSTALSIAAGSTLDLNGLSQQVASLSDYVAGAGGNIVNSGSTTALLMVSAAGGATTFSGLIQGGGTLNGLGLAVSGSGLLTLAGSNTYTGTTTLAGGTLNVGAADGGTSGPLGNGGTIVFAGGTLQYSLANQFDYSPRFSTAANQKYNVNTNGQNVTWAAALTSNGGSLTKFGAGMLTVSGNNTYGGPTTVSGGTLVVQNNPVPTGSNISIASGAILQYSNTNNVIQSTTTISGSGTLLKTGSGILTFGAGGGGAITWNLRAGALIDVEAGTLKGGWGARDNWTRNLASLNVAGGAIFWGDEANVVVDALSGSGTILSGFNGAGYTNFTFGANNGNGTFNGVLANNEGVGNYVKTGTGTQVLSGSNTYTGSTTVSGGTLQLGTGFSGQDGSIASTSGVTNNAALVYNLYGSQTAGYVISGSGGLTKTGQGVLTLSASSLFTGATAVTGGTLQLGTGANGQDGSLNSISGLTNNAAVLYNLYGNQTVVYAVSGSGSLAKLGAGTLTLTASNTYTGTTTLNAGVVNLARATREPPGRWAIPAPSSSPAARSSIRPPTSTTIPAASARPPTRLIAWTPTVRTSPGQLP